MGRFHFSDLGQNRRCKKMVKGKKDINLKLGLALVFSIGGMFFSFIRNKTSKSPFGSSKNSDCSTEGISSRGSKSGKMFDPLAGDINGELHNPMLDLSIISKSNADKDVAYLLPEFDDLMKEFDTPSKKENLDLSEVNNLQNTVKRLKERERGLKAQLLEYSRFKEQEKTTLRELQSRLKLNTMESKLLTLKVESLKTENKRLVSQTADYDKVLSELESARAKIKLLKTKLLSETAQNKERILGLQQRVQKMQENDSSEIESNVCKFKDLEAEAEELRKSNDSLSVEKAELLQKLQRFHMMDTSVLEDDKTGKLREESERLTKQNEELKSQIENLQADRCSDVEELVYLKWVNACLRYELRNHQPDIGKIMARDLSKTLSPNSESRAKELILEYANKEHEDINVPELDSDQWSSSQNSNLTDSGEIDELYKKKNKKFFAKLVKFLGAHKRIDSIAETEGSVDSPFSSDGQKSDLVKYAEVFLKDSTQKPSIRVRRRSKGFVSF